MPSLDPINGMKPKTYDASQPIVRRGEAVYSGLMSYLLSRKSSTAAVDPSVLNTLRSALGNDFSHM